MSTPARKPASTLLTAPGLLALGLCAVLGLPAAAQAQAQPQAGDDGRVGDRVVQVSNEDREMNAAIRKARATLDTFLATARKPPPGTSDFKLKVRFSDANGSEHMWVIPFRQVGARFEGRLSNTPEIIENLQNGQTVRFGRADISDWGYMKDGQQIGSYTVCALFKSMPAADVQRYKQDHGFVCAD